MKIRFERLSLPPQDIPAASNLRNVAVRVFRDCNEVEAVELEEDPPQYLTVVTFPRLESGDQRLATAVRESVPPGFEWVQVT